MSETTKRNFLALLVIAVVVGALSLTVAAASKSKEREIILIAEDMAFYLPNDSRANPPLDVAPGETVRLTLVNRDRGLLHDWAVDSLELTTRLIQGDGSTDSVLFTAPNELGRHEYVCSTHAVMMRGELVVR